MSVKIAPIHGENIRGNHNIRFQVRPIIEKQSIRSEGFGGNSLFDLDVTRSDKIGAAFVKPCKVK